MRIDEDIKYKLDVKETLFANMFWLFSSFIAIGFIILGFKQVALFENEINHLLGIIIISLATVKILGWVGGPRLHMKERIKP